LAVAEPSHQSLSPQQIIENRLYSSKKSKPNPTLIQSAEFATSQLSLLEALSSPGDAHRVVLVEIGAICARCAVSSRVCKQQTEHFQSGCGNNGFCVWHEAERDGHGVGGEQ
jgi:hypothetical protein